MSTPNPEPASPAREEPEETLPRKPKVEPWVPTPIPYSEAFENSIMNTVLNPHGAFQPPSYVPENPEPPNISPSELPLPLHDYRRIYPSPIPGILLPHPTYTLHGAPGPSREQLTQMAQELVEKHNIRTHAQFIHWVEAEIAAQMRELRERMRRRQAAIRENERIMAEIRRLDMERDMERRVAERWRSARKASGASGGGEGAKVEEKEDGEMESESDSDIGAVMG